MFKYFLNVTWRIIFKKKYIYTERKKTVSTSWHWKRTSELAHYTHMVTWASLIHVKGGKILQINTFFKAESKVVALKRILNSLVRATSSGKELLSRILASYSHSQFYSLPTLVASQLSSKWILFLPTQSLGNSPFFWSCPKMAFHNP